MKLQTVDEVSNAAPPGKFRRTLMVTALPDEMSAVRAHLHHVGSCAGRWGHIYECGTFTCTGDDWLVVVCETGPGTHDAQSAVTSAAMDFGPFELIVFVGIAGGRKSEAHIGSVIAASLVYWPYSGKFDKGFSSRPREFPVDTRLVRIARKVARDAQWHSRIRPLLGGQLPSPQQIPQPFPPASFVAPIVSVEAVSADPASELEKLISNYCGDAHAVEMEGYGALHAAHNEHTPATVIRGISDKLKDKDPDSDRILQPIACMHASAFAFEMLDYWTQTVPRPSGGTTSPEPTLVGSVLSGSALSYSPALSSQPAAAQVTSPNAAHSAGTTTLVLNFNGGLADFDPAKIDQILDHLKLVTGNSNLRLIKTEEGSVRLFIEATLSDRAKILAASDELRNRFGSALLGVADDVELAEIAAAKIELRLPSQQLLQWPRSLHDGSWLNRPELDELLKLTSDEDHSVVALTGDPGSGKSALLSSLSANLKHPVLAIKADLLDVTVKDEKSLQQYLGLSRVPSEQILLISRFEPVFLIMDQLDALAAYVDIQTGRLNVLLNLVRKLGGLKNIYIVLSVRTFEYNHDVRFRSVDAANLHLTLPSWSDVAAVLERNKLGVAHWPADAQALLRSPQALNIFLELINIRDQAPFATYQEMLDRLWGDAIFARPNGKSMNSLVSRIAADMADEESLWLPRARYETEPDALNDLLAAKILSENPANTGRIGFSHQTLFEHALARNFVLKDNSLSKFVVSREASLFIRPKLLAALHYVRSVSPQAYDRDIREIWSSPNLRRHLQLLLVEFMGAQAHPTNAEYEAFKRFVSHANNVPAAYAAVTNSEGWFSRIADGEITSSMRAHTSNDNVSGILIGALRFAHSKVLSLIRQHWLPDASIDRMSWGVLQHAVSWDEDAIDVATTILGRTDVEQYSLDHAIGAIGAQNPQAAIRLFAAKLNRNLSIVDAQTSSSDKPRRGDGAALYKDLIERSEDWSYLEALAETDPQFFLKTIWPWLLIVLGHMERESGADDAAHVFYSLPYDADFRFSDEPSNLQLPEHPLLGGVRAAVEELAKADSAGFLVWMKAQEHHALNPVQRVLAHGLTVRPKDYARCALAFMTADSRRLWLGNLEDYSSTTKRLVQVAGEHWSKDESTHFEQYVLSYRPNLSNVADAKRRQSILHLSDVVRRAVLSALPSLYTPEAAKFLQEQTRRDPKMKVGAEFSGVRAVGSAMSAAEMAKATDDQIIGAFKLLPDATEWDHPRDMLVGGNIQLAREFANFAKDNPGRARQLIGKMSPEFGTRAAGYALDSMGEEITVDQFEKCLLDLVSRKFDGEEFRISVAGALRRLLNRNLEIPQPVLTVLRDWRQSPLGGSRATNERDEEDQEAPDDGSNSTPDDTTKATSILWGFMGSHLLPGGSFPVMDSLLRIYLTRNDHEAALSLLMSHLDQEADPAIWLPLVPYLAYFGAADDEALRAFFDKFLKRFPQIAFTREMAVVMAHLRTTHAALVWRVLNRWRESSHAKWHQAFGEVAALIVIPSKDQKAAGDLLKDSADAVRTGIAFTAVHLWKEHEFRSVCTDVLQKLILTASPGTWSAVSDFFRLNEGVSTDANLIEILRAIRAHIDGAAKIDPDSVAKRLQQLLPDHADLVFGICRGMVSNWRTARLAGRQAPSMYFAVQNFVDIAITLHRLGPETREQGTALFDDLMELNAEAARSTLSEIDENRLLRAGYFRPSMLTNKHHRRRPSPRMS